MDHCSVLNNLASVYRPDLVLSRHHRSTNFPSLAGIRPYLILADLKKTELLDK